VTNDSYTDIEVELDDPVCTIRLNRPERLNAFTYHTLAELRRAVDHAAVDPAVVGIVITGNGRGFCSGLDAETLRSITEAAAGGDEQAGRSDPKSTEVPGLFTYLLQVPKPVIAAVNGVAAGGGFVLAMMCDIRFAAPEASFLTVFLKRGLAAEHGTTWTLPRLLGPGRALDLLWSSRKIGAAEAREIGLVDYIVENDAGTAAGSDVVSRAQAYVRELAAAASPASMADAKRMVYEQLGMGYPDALRQTDAIQNDTLSRRDAYEGARALIEKREPNFDRLGS